MAAADVWELCRAAVADLLASLNLTDPATGKRLTVYRNLWADERATSYPCLVVSVDEGEPVVDDEAFGHAGCAYPVAIAFKQSAEAGATDNRAAFYQGVFRDVQNAFRSQLLPGVPTVWFLKLRTLRSLERDREKYQRVETALVVECHSVEPLAGVPA